MDSFLIQLSDNQIAVYENEDNHFIALKHKGEEFQDYHNDTFWDWWRKKVDYEGRAISFVVITDQETFSLPQNILIDKENKFLKVPKIEKRLSMLSKGYHLFSFPKVESFKSVPIDKEEFFTKEKILIKVASLKSYFQEKTDEYRN